MSTVVLYDLETTGLHVEHHVPIQIAAVACQPDWKVIEEFEVKIHFDQAKADAQALELNSFNPETWKAKAIDENQAVHRFESFLRQHADHERISKRGRPYRVAQLAGHNIVGFDNAFLWAMFKRHGVSWVPADFRTLDTIQLALWAFRESPDPCPENYRLETLAKFFGVKHDAHDALGDVRANARVAHHLETITSPQPPTGESE